MHGSIGLLLSVSLAIINLVIGFCYSGTSASHSMLHSSSRLLHSSILKNGLEMMNKGFGFKSKLKEVKFKYTGNARPGTLSKTRMVPPEILRPEYAATGKISTQPSPIPWVIEEKSSEDIAAMRISGRLAREVLDIAGRAVKPGISTDEIDAIVHAEAVKRNCYPSPLNYMNYPKSVCTSVNEIICHGIPDSSILKEGDIVNIDVTVFHNGFHGDCSETFCVGEVDDKAKDLIQVTYDCWVAAARHCKPGRHYMEIGGVIQEYVEKRGYSTVKNFCGHGIGKVFHANPTILHYRNNVPNGIMKVGHTFTIEPMICEGSANHIMWPDKWTAATVDGRRSAQFEHTFLMTETGLEPLTGKLPDSPRQWFEKVDEKFSE